MEITAQKDLIKVCPNPHCDEVAINVKAYEKHCRNCGARMIKINQEAYDKKYINSFFQYDYSKGHRVLYRPGTQYSLPNTKY